MNIYALSSGRGPSGIAIVRVSGKDTLKICKNLTRLKDINSDEVNYCKFYDPKNDKVIDPEGSIIVVSRGLIAILAMI
jgi:tRNA U34 5-carboxymethylaminomethyl modifying GTPase MnmE/TrmE